LLLDASCNPPVPRKQGVGGFIFGFLPALRHGSLQAGDCARFTGQFQNMRGVLTVSEYAQRQ
jgi:hypothetical protein